MTPAATRSRPRKAAKTASKGQRKGAAKGDQTKPSVPEGGFGHFFCSFIFAPAKLTHRHEMAQVRSFLPRLSANEVMEGAYRRSAGRLNAFVFAQGVIVGAMGNLFASALGHFIDRIGPLGWRDAAWCLLLLLSAGLIVSMTVGAIQRYRQNTGVETLFIDELRRRGGRAIDDSDDPDELLEMSPADR